MYVGITASGFRRLAQSLPQPWSAYSLAELRHLVRSVESPNDHFDALQALLAEWDVQLDYQEDMSESGVYTTNTQGEAEFEPSWDLVELTRESLQGVDVQRYAEDPEYRETVDFLKGFSGS